jgi:hypothetical protein
MTPKDEVRAQIREFQSTYTILASALMWLNFPDFPTYIAAHGVDLGSTISLGSEISEDERWKTDFYTHFKKALNNNNYNLNHLILPMMAGVTLIHDSLLNNNLTNHTPEFEFLRHLRNAFGHGNRFTFKNGEPRRSAAFHGLVIDSSLNGQTNVLNQFLGAGDIMNLLDHVHDQL